MAERLGRRCNRAHAERKRCGLPCSEPTKSAQRYAVVLGRRSREASGDTDGNRASLGRQRDPSRGLEPTGWTDACQVAIICHEDYAQKPIALASRGANAGVLGGSSRANAHQP